MNDLLALDELAGYPGDEPERITEADIDHGYALILAEMDLAPDDDSDDDYPPLVRFGVRGYYTSEDY